MNHILKLYTSDNPRNGQECPCDLFDKQGRLIIAKGELLTNDVIKIIKKSEAYVLHVEWQFFHKRANTPRTSLVIHEKMFNISSPELYFNIANWTQKFARQVQMIKPEILTDAAELLDQLFNEIVENLKLYTYFNLFKSYDNYLTVHSTNVTLLSAIIGKQMGFSKEKLKDLVMGAMFHDMGKLMIPKEILNKPGALDKEEYEYMKRHPKMGVGILNYLGLKEDVLACILQHHEKWDGRGYPKGLQREEIHPYAQIIALADLFDAVTTIRPYRLAYPPYQAIELIIRGRETDFCPKVVQAFLQVVNIYPEYSFVGLNTGEIGQVIAVSLNNLTRPLVNILYNDRGLKIKNQKTVDLLDKTNYFITSLNYGGNLSMNIMLIDDDRDCIVGLADVIGPSGHECELYTVPMEAVDAYSKKPFDVVITDMKMPGMNGIEVLQAIKSKNPNAKIIINTGYGDVETAIAAVNNGAYAFFGKPVNVIELLDTLEKINMEVESNKKAKEEHARLAIEYSRLKMAYEEMLELLKEKAGERRNKNE